MATSRIFMIALSVAVLWWGIGPVQTEAQTDQEIFTDQLTMPEGIAIDSIGQIVVHSDGAATTILTPFSLSGDPSDPVPVGAGPFSSRFLGSRLDMDRDNDRLYLLSPNGDLLFIDAISLQELIRYDLRALDIMVKDVYDMKGGGLVNFNLSPQTLYGDLAVYRSQGTLELFLTGLSDTTPFVLRLRVDPTSDTITSAQVVLISTVLFSNTFSTPRGIAVNSQGIVFTTLPIDTETPPDCPDAIVKFARKFPGENVTQPQVVDDSEGILSWGMSVDTADNVYATMGGMINSACREDGASSLVFVSTALEPSVSIRRINVLPATIARPQDVAVSPLDDRQVYLTISNFNTVLRLPAISLSTP